MENTLTPISCREAEEMFHGNPFSFVETLGTKCTVLNVCYSRVVTAANCVKFNSDRRSFEIFTSVSFE